MPQSAFYLLMLFAAGCTAATVATVRSDITAITTIATAFDNAIVAFPEAGGSLADAIEVHNTAVELGVAIDKGTTDVNDVSPSPVAEADGKTILSDIQPLQRVLIDSLTHIVDKIASFENLPAINIPFIIRQDLINLNKSNSAFEAGIISSVPVDLKSSATAVKTAVDAAFATAIAAYHI